MSLAELPELIGFFSYSREDDIGSGGRLTKLRERIHEELRSQLGRRKGNFRVWQDKTAIAEGAIWGDEIRAAVDQSVFFVPIITPTAIKSDHCKAEFEHFLDREKQLGRNDLVFPILYIRVPELENESQWRRSPVLRIVGERQYLNWLDYRHLDMDSKEIGVAIERFCRSIHDALCRPWLSPDERRELQRAKDEQDAQRLRAEEAQRQKEAESRRLAEELRAKNEMARKAALGAQPVQRVQVKNPEEQERPADESSDREEQERLQETIRENRGTMVFICSVISVSIAICCFLYWAIMGLPLLSIGGLIGWGAIAALSVLILGGSKVFVEFILQNREVSARLRQLKK